MFSSTIRGRARQALAGAVLMAIAGCSDAPDESSETAPPPAAAARSGAPSIVLVVIESLRVDAVAGYGPDRTSPLAHPAESATPHLDGMLATGRRFDQAIAASSATVTSHASMFTGQAAHEHGVGVWTDVAAPPSLETIAEQLSAQGYQTAGFSRNPWISDDSGLNGGFEDFGGLRPGCWINIVPAAGLILIPEASASCVCNYPLQTSMAFLPKPADQPAP